MAARAALAVFAATIAVIAAVSLADSCTQPSMRPPVSQRKFVSQSVENLITEWAPKFKDPNVATLFANCIANTLDTTVYSFTNDTDGDLDTFIITGDIAAMWLRDSANQVHPYVPLARNDSALLWLLRGVIHRHVRSVTLDPYCNAYNLDATVNPGPHQDDSTTKPAFAGTTQDAMNPLIFERKYELDSLVNVLHLSNSYYSATGDLTPFGDEWQAAVDIIFGVFQEQQRSTADAQNNEIYFFQRTTSEPTDSLEHGYGPPAAYTGMIKTGFRPSDDAAKLPFNIPANAYAYVNLNRVSTLLSAVGRSDLASTAETIAQQINTGINKYGIMDHPTAGTIYAYEVDGFGNQYFMDDANVPSLLSLPFLGYEAASAAIYQATRAAVLSSANPYYFSGSAGSGVGGPHNGYGWIWPMSLMMRILTSTDEGEIQTVFQMLIDSSSCSGLMHESFWKDSMGSYTRPWFAWANSMFGTTVQYIAQNYPSIIFNS